jgi:DNA processing protein
MQLNLARGVGPGTIFQILSFIGCNGSLPQDFFTSPEFESHQLKSLDFEAIFNFTEQDFISRVGLTSQAAKACFVALQDSKLFDSECELLVRHKIDYVTLLDDDYPELLRTIHYPPPVLYIQGEPLDRHAKRLAIVGARAADEYAQSVLAAVLPDVVAHGWQIVSGGALGADAFAHEITVESGGRTIVVLGSGLLSWYPRQNYHLFERVIKSGGTIISTFSLESEPDRGHFPARNRIISGLSQGCVVVQAARKSGALITSKFALDQGRQIFAVPGTLFSPLSEGCHDLIAQGACIVTSAQSILEVLDGVGSVEAKKSLATLYPAKRIPPTHSITLGYQVPKEKEQVDHPVLNCFEGAMTLDQLAVKSGHTPDELYDLLFTLQLEGFVKQNFAGLWERL